MRFRTVLLIALILLVAGFVALNLEAILQPTTLHLGVMDLQAPVGLVLLGTLVVVLFIFLSALVYFQTAHLMEIRRVTREANEQRNLADKAEASRFTELREFLKAEFQSMASRDANSAEALAQKMDGIQSALSTSMEETANGINAHLGELEDRLDRSQPPS